MARWIDQLKQWAKQIKRDVYAVWFAARDPETPFLAKLAALLVAAYAMSQKPSSYIAALVFIIVWLGVAYLAYIYLYRPTI
ncbi:MAG: hypothetical protein GX151_12610 [Gammaproteobacteria bacterium]|nr:hypothetical protein [Gammaproteobacteria bacterium]